MIQNNLKKQQKRKARKKQLDENSKLGEKEDKETIRAEKMAEELLEQEEMKRQLNQKLKKRKKEKEKKKKIKKKSCRCSHQFSYYSSTSTLKKKNLL